MDDFQSLFTDPAPQRPPKVGDVVEGVVQSIGEVDLVLKVDRRDTFASVSVPLDELLPSVDVGSRLKVYLYRERADELLGSVRLARRIAAWDAIATAANHSSPLRGRIGELVMGGRAIELENGVRGFWPSVLAREEDPGAEVELAFYVIAFDRDAEHLRVSRRSPVELATRGPGTK